MPSMLAHVYFTSMEPSQTSPSAPAENTRMQVNSEADVCCCGLVFDLKKM